VARRGKRPEAPNEIVIIGAGLAGSEAAWQASQMGIDVTLYEMRPGVSTPAHTTGDFAELVCSNSLGSDREGTAPGLLKEELRALGSIILRSADKTRVPAGQALAVDRGFFASGVTKQLEAVGKIKVVREEVVRVPQGAIVIIATGPLTSSAFSEEISSLLGRGHLHFFDAVAPIISGYSVDWSRVYWASRYGKGDADYANCAMNEEEYHAFYESLVQAETAEMHEFESLKLFEGCMPIEEIARRGRDTLRYGPLKPVGLIDPRTGRRPYAVVQLRKENVPGSLFNMVGFQTRLKQGEQMRVFRMIPGLEEAEFVRYGMMHRNTFVNGPEHLAPTLQLKENERIFMAGQITGVEGYMESTAMGLVCGINAARLAQGKNPLVFPEETAIGSLCSYVSTPCKGEFQPMNVNFGLLPDPPQRARKSERRMWKVASARQAFKDFVASVRSS